MGDDERSSRGDKSMSDTGDVGDTHDIGDARDVGDTRDVRDTRDPAGHFFDLDDVGPSRGAMDESIEDDDLTMVDPVCGNRVEMTSLFSAGYRGRTFIFDTEECRDAFLASPEAYVAAA